MTGPPDYNYRSGKGWYKQGTYLFYETRVVPIKKAMAVAGSWLLWHVAR
jgi:hypothetical protein